MKTENNKADLTIDNLRSQYLNVLEHGKVVFFVVDEKGIIEYVSEYIEEILHYKPTELKGRSVFDLASPCSIIQLKKLIALVGKKTDEPIHFQGIELFCSYCIHHFFDGMILSQDLVSGKKFTLYLHDVTDRKVEAENLSMINLELDSFIYRASHDLKSPLASLSGLINLSEKSMPAENKEYTDLMKRSVKRLDQYITKLAHYSRNSNIDLEYNEVNFEKIINDIVETYKFLPNGDRIDFRLSISKSTKVFSDLFRLQLILNNLISNAVKYCNPYEADPFIEITVVSTTKNFRVKIKDNGIGIANEYKDKVFNMFQRATTQSEGSGIGLFIVKKALLKMGGAIEIESTYGEGTQFTITIPNHFKDCEIASIQ
ncbi:MAG: ATP-binding protein [Cyclobacteriaceae bacterium]